MIRTLINQYVCHCSLALFICSSSPSLSYQVLGVDVDMKAILSIDILFHSSSSGGSSGGSGGSGGCDSGKSNNGGTSSGGGSRSSEGKSSIKRIQSTTEGTTSVYGVETRIEKIEKALVSLVAAEVLVCVEISRYATNNGGDGNSSNRRKNKYEWGFASSQVRAAVYSTMTFGVRQGIHAALTQYYRLTFPNDLSHFASIVSYHAEASGDIDLAVETSFNALLIQEKSKNYMDAHSNLEKCIGLLLQNTKTREDQMDLIGCYLRMANICIIMANIDSAITSCLNAEKHCLLYFERSLPDKQHYTNDGDGSHGGVTSVLFGCCSKDPVRIAYKTVVKIQKDISMAKVTGGHWNAAEKSAPLLVQAYEKIHAAKIKRVETNVLSTELKAAQSWTSDGKAPLNMKTKMFNTQQRKSDL